MNKGRGFQNGWWLLLITLGVMLATELPFAFAASEQYNFAFMLFSEFTLIIPIFVGFSFVNLESSDGRVIENMGFKGFPLRLLPFIILLPVCGQFFINYTILPIQSILTILFGGMDYSFASSVESFWQNVLLMCILAPVFEEILCRGILMKLMKRYGTAKMLVYSSLGFAMLHMDIQAVIPLFFVGMILGIIRITTGSIFAAMIAHAASNLFSLVSITFMSDNEVASGIIISLLALAFPFVVWFYLKKCNGMANKSDLVHTTSSPTGFSTAFILLVVIFVIVNLVTLVTRLLSGDVLYDISRTFMS